MDIEASTRKNIIGLDQQLKTLREEITAKLQLAEGDNFVRLINEVDEALKAISPVVALAASDHKR